MQILWENGININFYNPNPQKALPCMKTRILVYRLLRTVKHSDLQAWARNEKERKQKSKESQ